MRIATGNFNIFTCAKRGEEANGVVYGAVSRSPRRTVVIGFGAVGVDVKNERVVLFQRRHYRGFVNVERAHGGLLRIQSAGDVDLRREHHLARHLAYRHTARPEVRAFYRLPEIRYIAPIVLYAIIVVKV